MFLRPLLAQVPLAVLAVLSASVVQRAIPAQCINCVAEMILPPSPVSATVSVASDGTLSIQLAGVGETPDIANGTFVGWAADQDSTAFVMSQNPLLYSTYGYNLPAGAQRSNWDRVNYVLNHKQGTASDVQAVIRTLLTGAPLMAPTPASSSLLADATANGHGYIPAPGKTLAVLLYQDGFGGAAQDDIIEARVPACGKIGDFVWNDLNADGIQQPNEPGLNGITVLLQQVTESGFKVIGTTVTTNAPAGYAYPGPNPSGYYQFTGVCPGSYFVSVNQNQPNLTGPGYLPTVAMAGNDPAVDSNYSPSVTSLHTIHDADETIDFGFTTVTPAGPTTLVYTGVTSSDYSDTATLSATLTDSSGNPIPGESVTFTLGSQSCTSVTDNAGKASCPIVPSQAAGNYQVNVSFGGDSKFQASTTVSDFKLTPEETSIQYTGAVTIDTGASNALSAVLLDGKGAPIVGRSVQLSVGGQTCTAVTNSVGKAQCTISGAGLTLGPGTVVVSFSSDGYYNSVSLSTAVTIYSWPGGSNNFVVGDLTWELGGSVEFWGAQWAKLNSLSGGPGPNAFKGYVDLATPTPPTCGGTWVTRPGNSSKPPDSIPSYMAIIVSSTVTKTGEPISGNTPALVVVKTNPGYAGNPGHAGTGTVVAVICKAP